MTGTDCISPASGVADQDAVVLCDNATGASQPTCTPYKGFHFARHLRRKYHEEGGAWSADAVYTKTPTLPYGMAMNDVDVARAGCEQSGIPMV